MKKYLMLVLVGLMAVACKQNEIQQDPDAIPVGEPIEVALSLSFDQPQAIGRAEQATTTWSGDGFDAQITTEPSNNPRSKAVAEDTVANVWVLQFDGTVAASKLISKSYVANYKKGAAVQLLKSTTANKVAIVANTFDAAWANAFTLNSTTWQTVGAASKAVAAQSDVLRASGATDCLPMSGSNSDTLTLGSTLEVSLTRTVVKVVVNLRSGADLRAKSLEAQLCNVPNATSWFPDTGTGVWPASPTVINYARQTVAGITTTGFQTLTYWVPINRRGTVAGTTRLTRATNAPTGATYLNVDAGVWRYEIHLGADFATDYNLKANTTYTYSLTLQTDPKGQDSRTLLTSIDVGVLRWATGNLVASGNNSCKIGAPSDYGVYFQFGSLVGWTGGATGNGVGAGSPTLDKAVWPTAMGATKPTYTWQSKDDGNNKRATLAHKYFNYTVTPWDFWGTASADIGTFDKTIEGQGAATGTLRGGRYANLGVGDPCTYYLGEPWRTPTSEEYLTLIGSGGANTNKAVPLKVNNTELAFPASGYRNYSTALLNDVATFGCYWSSSVYTTIEGTYLLFRSGEIIAQSVYVRSNGFPVRCVQSLPVNPPAESDYVKIGSLKWAKGNLVAKNNNECKVGAPTDYGLYFQFGSLVGWTGGTTGNGVGTGEPLLDKAVWPTKVGLVKPTFVWQNVNSNGIKSLVHYYFNYSVAPWDAMGAASADIGTFAATVAGQGDTKGNLRGGRYANLGVGDPCTYYLGEPWRLPTSAEWGALLGANGANTNNSIPLQVNLLSFPASGYRIGTDGSLLNVSAQGAYWSSSFYDYSTSLSIRFTSSSVTSQASANRSFGFPVRCVSK